MARVAPLRIAVIADAHYHDIDERYGLAGTEPAPAFRSLAETARAIRLLNESRPALIAALDEVVARGIELVVLLGDLTDDGQRATVAGLKRLLDSYSRRHEVRFLAVPGNHDLFGPDGRHRSRRFARAGGHDVVTSDPELRDSSARQVRVSDQMYCPGYREGLPELGAFGFFRQPWHLHWESPFGGDDAIAARQYEVTDGDGESHRLIDGSYLVEPVVGLWLAMIDANAFAPPIIGEFGDSADAGWEGVLEHKPFLIKWLHDLVTRSINLNKQLIVFSHYPVLDMEQSPDHGKLLGVEKRSRRPSPAVAEAFSTAGAVVHFGGHLHVNHTARHGDTGGALVDVAVPSLVAYPAAFKVLSLAGDRIDIETPRVNLPMPPEILARYRQEAVASGLQADRLLSAADYRQFVSAHAGHLVGRRHLRRSWRPELAAMVRSQTLLDQAQQMLAGRDWPEALGDPGALARLPLLGFVEDWYRLRAGGDLALSDLAPENIEAGRRLAALWAERTDTEQVPLGPIFESFGQALAALPSDRFSIDPKTGEIARARPQTARPAT